MNASSRSLAVVLVGACLVASGVGAPLPAGQLLELVRARLAESPTAETAQDALEAIHKVALSHLNSGLNDLKDSLADSLIARHKSDSSSLLDLISDSKNQPNAMKSYVREKKWTLAAQKAAASLGVPGGETIEKTRSIEDQVVSKGFDVESEVATYQLNDVNGADPHGWAGRARWGLKRYDLHQQWSVEPHYNSCEDSESDFCTEGWTSSGYYNKTTDDFCFPEDLYRDPSDSIDLPPEPFLFDPTVLTGTALSACGRSLRLYRFKLQCDVPAINDLYNEVIQAALAQLNAATTPAPNPSDADNPFAGLTFAFHNLRVIMFEMELAARFAIDTDDFVLAAQDSRTKIAMNMFMDMTFFGQHLVRNMNIFQSEYTQSILRSLRLGDPGSEAFEAPDRCYVGSDIPDAPSAGWHDANGHQYPSESVPTTTTDSNPFDLSGIISADRLAALCKIVSTDDSPFIAPISGNTCPVSRASQASAAIAVAGEVDVAAAASMESSDSVDAQAPAEYHTIPAPPEASFAPASGVAGAVAAGFAAYAAL